MFSTCTLPRPFLHVKDRLNLTVYLYRLFCLIWSVKNHLIIFYTQENGGVGQRIFQLGYSQAEILTIFVCPYMGIVEIQDMYSDPYNLPQDGYRMFIFVPIPPFSYPENQNKWVKKYFAARLCSKCPYMIISIYGHFGQYLVAK